MYNNIYIEHFIHVIEIWLVELNILPTFIVNFSLKAIIAIMELFMRNDHFEFGDFDFLRLLKTAMGKSSACMWVIIYYINHAAKTLLLKYKERLSDWKLDGYMAFLDHGCVTNSAASCAIIRNYPRGTYLFTS